MPENTNTTNYCDQHSACNVQIQQNCKDIDELKTDVKQIKDDMAKMQVAQGHSEEKFITIFSDIHEIKELLKSISENIDKQNENFNNKFKEFEDKQNSKKDTFKEWVSKVGMKVLEYGITGGIIIYILKIANIVKF